MKHSFSMDAVEGCVMATNQFRDSGLPKQDAAVLMLLQEIRGSTSFILIERAKTLRFHGGEIAFPGGKRESSDRSPVDTALREVWEELRVPNEMIRVAGTLPDVTTLASGFEIVPVVGFLDNHFHDFKPDLNEVSCVIPVPVSFFYQKPINLGPEYYFLKGFDYDGKIIWGATARMIHHFICCMEKNPGYLTIP